MNTLLIVEDEKMIRQGLRAMVQRAPVEIETILECKNGEEALEILSARPVDVMITDIRMPKMDGITLAREMQTLPHVPLTVVVSGFDDFSYAVNMLRQGVRDYILKPVEREKVYEVLLKLEAELQARHQSSQNNIRIGHQVLRALMFGAEPSSDEMQAILAQYGGMFFEEPYVVLYLCGKDAPEVLDDDILQLADGDGCQVLILRDAVLVPMLENALQPYNAGISAAHQGLDMLRRAYAEAAHARGAAFATGRSAVYGGDAPAIGPTTDNSKELERIVHLLGTSNTKEAKKVLGQILLEVQGNQMHPEDFGATMNRLVAKIIATYRTMLPVEEELSELANVWDYPSAFAYYTAMCTWMDSFCKRLTEEFDDYQNKQKIQKAVVYIQQNFSENLNMAMVSNHVSMNYSLFSYLFKQYTGANFVGYLQNLRVNEAKRLLAETDRKVLEISVRVGFQNEKHFMKTFKMVCGVSPSEYRRNLRLGEADNAQR